jgi:CubicO group peptidase (beta-lactamase class C family)
LKQAAITAAFVYQTAMMRRNHGGNTYLYTELLRARKVIMKKIYLLLIIWAVLSCAASAQTNNAISDETAIRAAALDYIEGWYEGNAERMERALHPDLAKRIVITNAQNGRSRLDQMSAMGLVQNTRRGGGKDTPKDKQIKEVTILDKFENAASVKVVAESWIDYMHLAKFNGRWVIVNVLWEMKPRSNQQSGTETQRISPADLSAEIDQFLKSQEKAGFSGAVLVAKNNKIIIDETYGSVSNSDSKPVFWIASNSKSFVAAAILKLQEQGKLSLADRIEKFFQNVPADKQQITVHHLLTHTAGLPHEYAADGTGEREKAVRDILALLLRWKVGEGYHYSNDGYNLLAAIVEVAAYRSFEDYLRAETFQPAGLEQTGLWGFENQTRIAPAANSANLVNAKATIYQNGKSVANWGYRGATGIYSTAKDLYKWMLALRQNKVLTAKSRERLWAKQILINAASPSEEYFYGYGWRMGYKDGERFYVSHGGNEDWLGHNSVMFSFENGDAFIVLSNAGEKDNRSWSSIVSRELQKKLGGNR